MQLDYLTLLFCGSIVAVITATLISCIAWYAKTQRFLNELALAFIGLALAPLLIRHREIWPDFASIIVANLLILLWSAGIWLAICRVTEQRFPTWWVGSTLTAFIAAMSYYTYWDYNTHFRVMRRC
ncbi:hypothetical protein [Aliagarivorans marinus]|uniref:hypothetical protein n=1 Tax=Aliagarivorans marinus TaxID=561965 RepID=UPI0004792081|nr:hypothetical protein [Aliagarivorans marinus]